MSRTLRVSIDDFGLSKGNSDTMLAALDGGAVTNVSVLANGDALAYGLAEFAKRGSSVGITLHFNLTEGKALAGPSEVALLVDREGFFRHSSRTLWLSYVFSGSSHRAALRSAVRAELAAQRETLERALAVHGLTLTGVDGHQHAHMVPFVFDLLALEKLPYVRLAAEPWYVVPGEFFALIGGHAIVRFVLFALSLRNRRVVRAQAVETNLSFIGFVFSGRMTLATATEGLYAASTRGRAADITEICFHPGTAGVGEVDSWTNADREWHYAPARERERALLTSGAFAELCTSFRAGTLTETRWNRGLPKLVRFVISGGTAAFTQLILLYVFSTYFGIWYLLANVLAFCFSFVVSFVLQKFWTFQDGSKDTLHGQLLSYLLVQLVSLAINSVLLGLLVEGAGLHYLLAEFLVLIFVAFTNFFVFKKLIFKRSV